MERHNVLGFIKFCVLVLISAACISVPVTLTILVSPWYAFLLIIGAPAGIIVAIFAGVDEEELEC